MSKIHVIAVQPGVHVAHRTHHGVQSYTHDFFDEKELRELVRHPGLVVIAGERLAAEGAVAPGAKEPLPVKVPVKTVPKGKS